jgi:hypothetical protein
LRADAPPRAYVAMLVDLAVLDPSLYALQPGRER